MKTKIQTNTKDGWKIILKKIFFWVAKRKDKLQRKVEKKKSIKVVLQPKEVIGRENGEEKIFK